MLRLEAFQSPRDCCVGYPSRTPVGLGIDGKPEALFLILIKPAMARIIEQEVIRLAQFRRVIVEGIKNIAPRSEAPTSNPRSGNSGYGSNPARLHSRTARRNSALISLTRET